MPVYLADILGHSRVYVNGINTIMLVLLIVLDIFFGGLSDKVGRKPLMLIAASGFMCLSYPLYWIIAQGGFIELIMAQLIFTGLAASFQGPLMALTLDLIPVTIRYTVGSLSYNLAYSLFGGTAPLVVVYLITKTKHITMPGLYLAVSAIGAVLILVGIKK